MRQFAAGVCHAGIRTYASQLHASSALKGLQFYALIPRTLMA
jgi:hypothetical protein